MSTSVLPGVGPDIGTVMIATVAATVFVTGALKGIVGLGLSTGSVVAFSLLYGIESALCLLIAPTVATNLWQGASGGHARALIRRFWPGLAAIVPGVWAGSELIGALAPGEAERGLGIALMLYAGLALARRGGGYAPRRERALTLIAGSANGVITGATGVLTIPMVPYMEALSIERDALVQLNGDGVVHERARARVHPGRDRALRHGLAQPLALGRRSGARGRARRGVAAQAHEHRALPHVAARSACGGGSEARPVRVRTARKGSGDGRVRRAHRERRQAAKRRERDVPGTFDAVIDGVVVKPEGGTP